MSDELKPCPFCGSDAVTDFIDDESYLIECSSCASRTSCCDSKEEAIAAWNRRATPSPSTAPTCQTCAGSRVDPGGLAICRDCGTAPTVEVDELDHDAEMFAMLESDAAQEGAIHKMDGAATWAAFQGWLCARRAALASKPTAREAARQSIDTPEFRKLLGDLVRRASYNISGKASPAALIAHIDTWGGAAPAAGNTAQPKDSMAE